MEEYGTGLKRWTSGHDHPERGSSTKPLFRRKLKEKFVLVVGDSHLRSLVDGFVLMPEGCLSFGFSCTPGASASVLRREVQAVNIPCTPDLVCLLAPGNNITQSITTEQSGTDFANLIQSVLSRWTKVVVIDFPTRLTVEHHLQELLRQEYHRAARRLGMLSPVLQKYLRTVWCQQMTEYLNQFLDTKCAKQ